MAHPTFFIRAARALLLAAGLLAGPARGADATRVGSYDFGYFLSGDAKARL